AVARFNQLPFLSLGIVVRRLAATAIEREPVGRFISQIRITAPLGRLIAANLRRGPHATLTIKHGIVGIGGIIRRILPNMSVCPPRMMEFRAPENGMGPSLCNRASECRLIKCCSLWDPSQRVDHALPIPHKQDRRR